MREFASSNKTVFFEAGSGICHQLMIEKGYVHPGYLVVGSDSHTCTYGAVGALGTGIGSTEMAAVFLSGKLWFKIPHTIRINVEGNLPPMVLPKDLILRIIGRIRADGATYKTIEFHGSTIRNMNIEGRLTLSNMAIEMGAKAGIIEPDNRTRDYFASLSLNQLEGFKSDKDAIYHETVNIEVSDLEPQISCPHSVDNVKPLSNLEGIQVNQVFLGSCTNGRIGDLRIAAGILKGKKVKQGTRMIVIPASKQIFMQAISEGLIETFLSSGCIVCNPGCGPCVGAHEGVLAPDEVCVSTSNRNFRGRMGCMDSEIYLASPATAAATAIKGQIIDPRKIKSELTREMKQC
jgi:3-isopropylmalate/(R)-2-methylmalate dehydratase large subunit